MNQKKEANSESWEKPMLRNSERSLGEVARRGELESLIGVVLRRNSRPIITNVLSRWRVGVLGVWEEGRRVSSERGREPFGELGEVSEKAVEGWVKSEEWRGAHRYPVWYISGLGRAQKRGQDNGTVLSCTAGAGARVALTGP